MATKQESSIRIGNKEYTGEAGVQIGFAFDALIQIDTTCCNIDNAKHHLNKALEEIGKYLVWAKTQEAKD